MLVNSQSGAAYIVTQQPGEPTLQSAKRPWEQGHL